MTTVSVFVHVLVASSPRVSPALQTNKRGDRPQRRKKWKDAYAFISATRVNAQVANPPHVLGHSPAASCEPTPLRHPPYEPAAFLDPHGGNFLHQMAPTLQSQSSRRRQFDSDTKRFAISYGFTRNKIRLALFRRGESQNVAESREDPHRAVEIEDGMKSATCVQAREHGGTKAVPLFCHEQNAKVVNR